MENIFVEPYYQLDENSFCTTEIYVNDVLVSSFKGPETKGRERSRGLVPINHVLLQSGKYKVKGKMFPRQGEKALTAENAYLSIDFLVCESKSCKTTRKPFHPKIESPWDGLSENINYPAFEIQTEIEVKLPYVLDGWQNSVDLSKMDKDELFQKTMASYRQIYAIIAEHNAAKFLEISKEKEALQAKAFYMDEARRKEVRQSIAQLFSEKLQIKPLVQAELKMEIFGNGKLVCLRKADGSSPFQFIPKNEDEQGPIELEVKLHLKEKGGVLTVI